MIRYRRTSEEATLGQDTNEFGFALCRTRDGKLVRGPVAEGTPMNVTIPMNCPSGSNLVGFFHTHPKGVALPSAMDEAAQARLGVKTQCIMVPETREIACFRRRR